jgi:hypothetical protein
MVKIKKKTIPVRDPGGSLGYEMSRLPHFLDNQLTDGSEVVRLMDLPPFTPPPPRKFLVLIPVRD